MCITSYTFSEVSLRGEKSGKCAVCGKHAKRAEKFWQTQNPYNKNSDGSVKSRSDIMKELVIERDEWLKKPLYHQKCEPPRVSDDDEEFEEEVYH